MRPEVKRSYRCCERCATSATDLEQLRNVIAQRTFKVPQRRGKSHPKVLR